MDHAVKLATNAEGMDQRGVSEANLHQFRKYEDVPATEKRIF